MREDIGINTIIAWFNRFGGLDAKYVEEYGAHHVFVYPKGKGTKQFDWIHQISLGNKFEKNVSKGRELFLLTRAILGTKSLEIVEKRK